MEKGRLMVGFIRGTHGFAGECKVESASGEYGHLLNLKEVTLRHGEQQREAKVESVSLGNAVAYVKFFGIDSDETVKKLIGWGIEVPRNTASPWERTSGTSRIYETVLLFMKRKTDRQRWMHLVNAQALPWG